MADIERFRPDDRRQVEALYRRVFGPDMAEANTIVGQYAAMPVVVTVNGREVSGAWGMDVMVAPERQRQGLGEVLFRTWDRSVGAALGLGLSDSSYKLFQKLHW